MNYAMWIGNQFYSRDSYLKEAKKMGASKKIAYIPHNLVLGKTKIYLISDMSEQERKTYYKELKNRHNLANKKVREEGGKKTLKGLGPMPRGQPYVFGYFIANSVVLTTNDEEPIFCKNGIYLGEFFMPKQKDFSVEIYKLKKDEFGTMDERGCGSLKSISYYIISETNMQKIKELYESPTLESENVIVFDTPILYEGKHFRGMLETEIDA